MNDSEYSLDDLLWFLRVAQAGSLSSAATQLGVPKSTLSRRLTRMETSLGVVLVQRNSRAFDRFAEFLRDVFLIFFERLGPSLNGFPLEFQSSGFENPHHSLGHFRADAITGN